MREQPWHLRRPSLQHRRSFENLVVLHGMTEGWINELKQLQGPNRWEGPSLITRGLSGDVAGNLWLLDALKDLGGFEGILDDTKPEDLLLRLQRTVWAAQAWTLRMLEERTNGNERQVLLSVLQQSSWKYGRKMGETRWPHAVGQGTEAWRFDLRAILLAAEDTAIAPYPNPEMFLIQRAVQSEASVELLACPHQSTYPEVLPQADLMCLLHSRLLQGYAYSINTNLVVETDLRDKGNNAKLPRCRLRWAFSS
jgi:hypothetical protein